MESIGEILRKKKDMTNTKTSNQLTYQKYFSEENNTEIKKCKVCGEYKIKEIYISLLKRNITVPLKCKCERKEKEKEEQEEKRREVERRLRKYKIYSLKDANFENSTLENWKEETKEDMSMKKLVIKYCQNWENNKKDNIGLLLYGKAGTGKTYVAFAIANELYKIGVSVVVTTVENILSRIKESMFNENLYEENKIINTIINSELLVLDDLGVENKTYWGYEMLYKIIDGRYRIKKPLIITTNFNLEELMLNLSLVDKKGEVDKSNRIYERIVEMCCVKINFQGESKRLLKSKQKQDKFLKI